MVKFFINKEGKLDMFKAVSTIIIFSGIIIICLTLSIEAKMDSKSANIKVDNLKETVEKIDKNVQKLLDLHTGKKGE